MLMPAIQLKSSIGNCVALDDDEKFNTLGLALAYAINSFTVLTGRVGWTTKIIC